MFKLCSLALLPLVVVPELSNCLMNTESVVGAPEASASISAEDSRNPIHWPFSTASIWNQPIGDGAEYTPSNLKPAYLAADTDHFFVLSDDSPAQDLFKIGGWRNRATGTEDTGTDLPLPDALIIPDTNEVETPNNSAALLLPDGNTLVQLNAMTRDRVGGPIYGVEYPLQPRRVRETIDGEGSLGGHGGSSLSSIGGTLRIGELVGDDPIRHALKINLWAQQYLSYATHASGGAGYRWPAIKADGYATAETYAGTNPELMMGSLLALPPDVTPEALGLQTEPAQKLFDTLQNYGAYVVDDTAWDSHALAVENGALQEFEYAYGYSFEGDSGPFHDDMMALLGALNIVTNSGPDQIGGGGTPRVPLAPELDLDAVTEVQELVADPTVQDTFEADFNGDGTLDLLWRNLATGANQMWLRDETGELIGGGNILPLASWDWQIVDTPDVNDDGRADLLWRDRTTGAEQVWYVDDIRAWIDPETGDRVARWIETASGPPRIESFGSSLSPNPGARYEAEDLTLAGYTAVDSDASGASGDQFVEISNVETNGTISGIFDGMAGLYQVTLQLFDETDGAASISVQIGDDTASIELDGALGDSAVSPLSLTQRIAYDAIALKPGDTFTITGRADGDELARIDAVTFTPMLDSAVSIQSTAAAPVLELPLDFVEPPTLVPEQTDTDGGLTPLSPAPADDEISGPLPVDSADDEGLDPTQAEFTASIITLTNEFRAEYGLTPVVIDPVLTDAAQAHTDAMAQYGFFSHLGLNNSTPLSRVESLQNTNPNNSVAPPVASSEAEDSTTVWAIAENIGKGYDTPENVIAAWKASPSHRAHLLNPAHESIGIGYAIATDAPTQVSSSYWTQILGNEVDLG